MSLLLSAVLACLFWVYSCFCFSLDPSSCWWSHMRLSSPLTGCPGTKPSSRFVNHPTTHDSRGGKRIPALDCYYAQAKTTPARQGISEFRKHPSRRERTGGVVSVGSIFKLEIEHAQMRTECLSGRNPQHWPVSLWTWFFFSKTKHNKQVYLPARYPQCPGLPLKRQQWSICQGVIPSALSAFTLLSGRLWAASKSKYLSHCSGREQLKSY